MYPKPIPKDPVQAKIVVKLCYGFIRERQMLIDTLDEIEGLNLYRYNKHQIEVLTHHLERYFPLALRLNCQAMLADKMNDFDRYKAHRWVALQVVNKFGRNFQAWEKARRIENRFYKYEEIPF